MADRPSHFALADAGVLLGGAAMLTSAFVHWIDRGPGSGLRGHALVDAVVALGRHVPALSAARLTIVWYLVPALGAGVWIACGLTGARSRASRIVGVVALVVAALAFGGFDRLAGYGRLGWGPKLALAGAALVVFSEWFRLPSVSARTPAVRQNETAGP